MGFKNMSFTMLCNLFLLLLPSEVLSLPLFPFNKLTLYGDAFLTHNGISLTTTSSCSSFTSIGRAFFIYPVRFLDPQTNSTASFSCHFSFSIISSPSCPSPGDGLAFLISSSTHFPSAYMGLPHSSSSISFFALEFDTAFDPFLADINDNHVAVDVDSLTSFASVDSFSHGIDLTSGKIITAWVEYKHPIRMLRVWLSYSSTRPPTPILATQIDLSDRFQDFMHVGFTASNRDGSDLHLIHHWKFKTFGYGSNDSMDVLEEGDCFLCYEGDSASESESQRSRMLNKDSERKRKIGEMALGLGGLTAFLVSGLAAMVVVCVFLTKKKGADVRKNSEQEQSRRFQTSTVPTRLSLSEIKSATMGFNQDRLVGEGASAKVYKGNLPYGGDVAVKRFERDNGLDCLHNPFATEFATMVGYLRHKNLVQLKGWCCEGNELVLVYEFLPNGSLNKVLHRNFNSSIVLSWQQRLNIVLGVAAALTYLHEECERQIIHRDVKTCNIMLDADFNAKLGDFGLAEVYEHSSSTRDATIPAGTMGYLAPEYVYSGVPTVKTDVYSFGVVVLEVATGRKPVEDDGTVVADYVWSLWEKWKLIQAADPRLMGKFDEQEMERMLLVGLLCVHPDYEKRPRVREATRILKKEAPLPLLPTRKPRVKISPICPDDAFEAQSVIADWLSTDEAPYLTPRSQFY